MKKLKKIEILLFFFVIALNYYVNTSSTSISNKKLIKILKKRDVSYYLANGVSNRISIKKKPSEFSCSNKEDEGHYEHYDCKKYWHCLYVGTIFENALERKCPIGTMFHPIERVCEISTMLTCEGWRKSIFGTDTESTTIPSADINEFTANEYGDQNLKISDDLNESQTASEELRTFNLMSTSSSSSSAKPISIQTSSSSTTTRKTSTLQSSTSTEEATTTSTTTTTRLSSSTMKPTEKPTSKIEFITLTSSSKQALTDHDDKDYQYLTDDDINKSVKINTKHTNSFSSNLFEKLREFNNTKSDADKEKLLDEFLNENMQKVANNSVLSKNFTILSSTGKKTIAFPLGSQDSMAYNETIANRLSHLAEVYSKKSNNSKIIEQIEMIKQMFGIRNRTVLNSKNFTSSLSTNKTAVILTKSSTSKNSNTKEQETQYYDNYDSQSSLINQDENIFEVLSTSSTNKPASTASKSPNEKGSGGNDEDLYYSEGESLENEDLSVLDPDLLLNLQLNLNNNDYFLNPKEKSKVKKNEKSKNLIDSKSMDDSEMGANPLNSAFSSTSTIHYRISSINLSITFLFFILIIFFI